jgi:hypothetical protein
MAWAALTGPIPGRSVSPGTRSLMIVVNWARLALSARAAQRSATASRRISAWRTAWSRLAWAGRRRRATLAKTVSVNRVRARRRSVSSPSRRSARSRLICPVLVVVSSSPGAQQDAQGFPVPVGTRGGQLGGVETDRGQHRQVRVDRVGFAPTSAVCATGLFGFDHRQSGGGCRPGQTDAVAAGALDRHHQPGPGRMLKYPSQCLGIADAVVAERAGRDHRAARVGDLNLMEVSVGVHPDDSHPRFLPTWPLAGCPSRGQRSTVGTGLGAVTTAADLSAVTPSGGQASKSGQLVGQAGAGNHDGQVMPRAGGVPGAV